MWALMVLSFEAETSMLARERGHKLASKGKPDPVRGRLRGKQWKHRGVRDTRDSWKKILGHNYSVDSFKCSDPLLNVENKKQKHPKTSLHCWLFFTV